MDSLELAGAGERKEQAFSQPAVDNMNIVVSENFTNLDVINDGEISKKDLVNRFDEKVSLDNKMRNNPESESKLLDLTGNGGVMKQILNEGVGDSTPSDYCTVSVHYIAQLEDGTVFDSTYDRREPSEFVLSKGRVLPAFHVAAATMRKGEKCLLFCSPYYAYGVGGRPPKVPQNSNIIFEFELLGWKGEDISPNRDGSIERYVETASSSRKTPKTAAHVKVHIIGKYAEKVYEDRQVEFDVGEGIDHNIIGGVEIAIQKIAVGETSRVIIAPKYAFGVEGNTNLGVPSNATVEYVITVLECELATDEWQVDEEQSMEQAKSFKEKGTKYLKGEKYSHAIKMYKRGNNYLSRWESEESKQIKLAINLNLALCYQKLGNSLEAKTACNEVLRMDSQNIKALYRRGQCYLTICDYEQALLDFEMIHKLDPSNKAAYNRIIECKEQMKEHLKREKKIYANMFTKFATADKQKESNDRGDELDVLESCGEWTEEEARKEADKAFERDNNIIMLN